MKRTSIILFFAGIFLLAGCSSLSNVASSAMPANSTATSAGTSCGTILANLYAQYKATGKIDLNNSAVLLNVAQLTPYYNSLKTNKSNPNYLASFAQGLVSGSRGVVTTQNSLNTVNSLLSLNGLSNITTATNSAATIPGITTELTTLLNSLKK
ncbi:MAG TPA: hypothetical protein VK152_00105 [Paludibacter sp.]|nr:hypothetical protein [Paludibacter sp.]